MAGSFDTTLEAFEGWVSESGIGLATVEEDFVAGKSTILVKRT